MYLSFEKHGFRNMQYAWHVTFAIRKNIVFQKNYYNNISYCCFLKNRVCSLFFFLCGHMSYLTISQHFPDLNLNLGRIFSSAGFESKVQTGRGRVWHRGESFWRPATSFYCDWRFVAGQKYPLTDGGIWNVSLSHLFGTASQLSIFSLAPTDS